jgi:NAD(P)-dependent dehydrogenase (short-subunit alcohol dehydrogenase family)
MNRYDLEDRRAVVTGGAGGIGRAIAARLLASGARVELWDVSRPGLDGAVQALGQALEQPDRVAGRLVDITDDAAVDAAAQDCAASLGRIDILINNAGILGEVKPLWETEPANFRRVIEVNLIGSYLVTRAVVAHMLRQEPRPNRGWIVNIASIQGKEGMPRAGAYSASKAALIALTKSLAKETAQSGIVVTCITPAAAETTMAQELTPQRRAEILGRIPMGRFVEVEEIARMVAWLCSEDCSYSTGGIFDLSGGRATY